MVIESASLAVCTSMLIPVCTVECVDCLSADHAVLTAGSSSYYQPPAGLTSAALQGTHNNSFLI